MLSGYKKHEPLLKRKTDQGENMKCPNCGFKFGDYTCITGEKAEMQDGDVSICINCGEVHQLRNGVLELVDIRDLPKNIRDLILKANMIRVMVKN